jgi:hypothetical protein
MDNLLVRISTCWHNQSWANLSNIRLVDTHPKRYCRANDSVIRFHEFLLDFLPFLRRYTRMIDESIQSVRAQFVRNLCIVSPRK